MNPGNGWALPLGILGLGLAVLALHLAGLTAERTGLAANLPVWSVADAARWTGPATGPLRLSGDLVARRYVQMPDTLEPALQGALEVRLRRRGTAEALVLYRWQAQAEDLLLRDGGATLLLDPVGAELPLFYDPPAADDPSPRVVPTPDGATVAVGALSLEAPARWAAPDVEVVISRSWLPPRLAVVVAGTLTAQGGAPRLISLPGRPVSVALQGEVEPADPRRGPGAAVLILGLGLTVGGAWGVRRRLRDARSG